jgi:hypothetical protein
MTKDVTFRIKLQTDAKEVTSVVIMLSGWRRG